MQNCDVDESSYFSYFIEQALEADNNSTPNEVIDPTPNYPEIDVGTIEPELESTVNVPVPVALVLNENIPQSEKAVFLPLIPLQGQPLNSTGDLCQGNTQPQVSHSSQQVSYASQQVSYASQQVSYASQQVSHASQQVSHASQQISYTSHHYASQQVSHASQQVSNTLPVNQALQTSNLPINIQYIFYENDRFAIQHSEPTSIRDVTLTPTSISASVTSAETSAPGAQPALYTSTATLTNFNTPNQKVNDRPKTLPKIKPAIASKPQENIHKAASNITQEVNKSTVSNKPREKNKSASSNRPQEINNAISVSNPRGEDNITPARNVSGVKGRNPASKSKGKKKKTPAKDLHLLTFGDLLDNDLSQLNIFQTSDTSYSDHLNDAEIVVDVETVDDSTLEPNRHIIPNVVTDIGSGEDVDVETVDSACEQTRRIRGTPGTNKKSKRQTNKNAVERISTQKTRSERILKSLPSSVKSGPRASSKKNGSLCVSRRYAKNNTDLEVVYVSKEPTKAFHYETLLRVPEPIDKGTSFTTIVNGKEVKLHYNSLQRCWNLSNSTKSSTNQEQAYARLSNGLFRKVDRNQLQHSEQVPNQLVGRPKHSKSDFAQRVEVSQVSSKLREKILLGEKQNANVSKSGKQIKLKSKVNQSEKNLQGKQHRADVNISGDIGVMDISVEDDSTFDALGMIIQCAVCQKVFSSLTALEDHMAAHDFTLSNVDDTEKAAIETYQVCDTCGKSMGAEGDRTQHKDICKGQGRVSEDLQHVCPVCNSVFNTLSDYQQHCKLHAKETTVRDNSQESHLCMDCGKLFTKFTALEKHMKTHKKNEQTVESNTAQEKKDYYTEFERLDKMGAEETEGRYKHTLKYIPLKHGNQSFKGTSFSSETSTKNKPKESNLGTAGKRQEKEGISRCPPARDQTQSKPLAKKALMNPGTGKQTHPGHKELLKKFGMTDVKVSLTRLCDSSQIVMSKDKAACKTGSKEKGIKSSDIQKNERKKDEYSDDHTEDGFKEMSDGNISVDHIEEQFLDDDKLEHISQQGRKRLRSEHTCMLASESPNKVLKISDEKDNACSLSKSHKKAFRFKSGLHDQESKKEKGIDVAMVDVTSSLEIKDETANRKQVSGLKDKDSDLLQKFGIRDLSVCVDKLAAVESKGKLKCVAHLMETVKVTETEKHLQLPWIVLNDEDDPEKEYSSCSPGKSVLKKPSGKKITKSVPEVKVNKLKELSPQELDKLLQECGMGISVPGSVNPIIKIEAEKKNTSETESVTVSDRRTPSPQPSTSNGRTAVNRKRTARKSLPDEEMIRKYQLKEPKVMVKSLTKIELALLRNPHSSFGKSNWLKHKFDSDSDSEGEWEIPEVEASLEEDEDDFFDLEIPTTILKKGDPLGSKDTSKEEAEIRAATKVSDDDLLKKFGMSHAKVVLNIPQNVKLSSSGAEIKHVSKTLDFNTVPCRKIIKGKSPLNNVQKKRKTCSQETDSTPSQSVAASDNEESVECQSSEPCYSVESSGETMNIVTNIQRDINVDKSVQKNINSDRNIQRKTDERLKDNSEHLKKKVNAGHESGEEICLKPGKRIARRKARKVKKKAPEPSIVTEDKLETESPAECENVEKVEAMDLLETRKTKTSEIDNKDICSKPEIANDDECSFQLMDDIFYEGTCITNKKADSKQKRKPLTSLTHVEHPIPKKAKDVKKESAIITDDSFRVKVNNLKSKKNTNATAKEDYEVETETVENNTQGSSNSYLKLLKTLPDVKVTVKCLSDSDIARYMSSRDKGKVENQKTDMDETHISETDIDKDKINLTGNKSLDNVDSLKTDHADFENKKFKVGKETNSDDMKERNGKNMEANTVDGSVETNEITVEEKNREDNIDRNKKSASENLSNDNVQMVEKNIVENNVEMAERNVVENTKDENKRLNENTAGTNKNVNNVMIEALPDQKNDMEKNKTFLSFKNKDTKLDRDDMSEKGKSITEIDCKDHFEETTKNTEIESIIDSDTTLNADDAEASERVYNENDKSAAVENEDSLSDEFKTSPDFDTGTDAGESFKTIDKADDTSDKDNETKLNFERDGSNKEAEGDNRGEVKDMMKEDSDFKSEIPVKENGMLIEDENKLEELKAVDSSGCVEEQ